MSMEEHWNQVYETKQSDAVSWFQPVPLTSLTLLAAAGLGTGSCVIDVGGGDSRLVDSLLDRGLDCLPVLDISEAAIARARTRLGARASQVSWIVGDVTAEWAFRLGFLARPSVFTFLSRNPTRARTCATLRGLKPADTC